MSTSDKSFVGVFSGKNRMYTSWWSRCKSSDCHGAHSKTAMKIQSVRDETIFCDLYKISKQGRKEKITTQKCWTSMREEEKKKEEKNSVSLVRDGIAAI